MLSRWSAVDGPTDPKKILLGRLEALGPVFADELDSVVVQDFGLHAADVGLVGGGDRAGEGGDGQQSRGNGEAADSPRGHERAH